VKLFSSFSPSSLFKTYIREEERKDEKITLRVLLMCWLAACLPGRLRHRRAASSRLESKHFAWLNAAKTRVTLFSHPLIFATAHAIFILNFSSAAAGMN
jgi:hypothetical protein